MSESRGYQSPGQSLAYYISLLTCVLRFWTSSQVISQPPTLGIQVRCEYSVPAPWHRTNYCSVSRRCFTVCLSVENKVKDFGKDFEWNCFNLFDSVYVRFVWTTTSSSGQRATSLLHPTPYRDIPFGLMGSSLCLSRIRPVYSSRGWCSFVSELLSGPPTPDTPTSWLTRGICDKGPSTSS